jgi:hypothetical protein
LFSTYSSVLSSSSPSFPLSNLLSLFIYFFTLVAEMTSEPAYSSITYSCSDVPDNNGIYVQMCLTITEIMFWCAWQ